MTIDESMTTILEQIPHLKDNELAIIRSMLEVQRDEGLVPFISVGHHKGRVTYDRCFQVVIDPASY